MKAKLSYKSKINIVIAIIILILFAASATTTYFFVKGNQDSSAFTENDSQTGENTVMQESTQGEQNNQKENDEVVIPNVNDNNSENTTTKAEGNRPSTQIGQNGVKGNGTATTTQTTGNVPNQEYVTERTEQETVLASENYAVAWSPLKIQANTTTKGCSIIRPEITAAKTVSENAVEGEKITYTITVANNGNEAGIAIVKDTIPEGTTFVERSIKVNKGETEYTAEDLANGIEINVQKNTEVSVEFEVIVNEDTVGTISNIAKVNEEDTNATKSIVVDTIKPVVFLNGVDGDKDYAEETIEENKTATYEDKGARGTDNVDGDFTIKKATKIVFVDVDKTETEVKKVNMGKAGEYILEYTYTDAAGNTATATRIVRVADTTAPEGTIEKSNNDKPTNKDVTVTLTTNEPVDCPEGWTEVEGSNGQKYTKIYEDNKEDTVTIVDKAGNKTVVNFEVKGIDKVAPEINIAQNVTIIQWDEFVEDIYDNISDTCTAKEDLDVKIEGTVDTSIAKTYTLTYTVTDEAGNSSTKTRTVEVKLRKVMFADGPTFNSKIKTLTNNIKTIERVDTEPTTNNYIEVQTEDSNKPIKMWVDKADNTKILWYTKAPNPKLSSDLSHMFSGLSSLTSQDITNVCDTSNITNMNSMFEGCTNLITLDISNFNTSKVTDMNSVFSGCSSLTTLNVSKWDTSKVTNMGSMFNGCSNLTTLDVSNFNTGEVTNMNSMFNGCSNLTTLDVSNFNTGKVTDMNSVFSGCSSLTTLNVSKWDTSKVTNMDSMFNGCSELTTLDVSEFNTSNVTSMASMFNNCENLTMLNVSNWDTSNVTSMSNMFKNCTNLTTVYASDSYVTNQVKTSEDMFTGCLNIKGGNGTTYDTSHIDKEYARIDTPRTPGYFTPITPYVMFESGSTFNTKIKKLYNDNIATIERPDTEEPLPQDNIVTIERASVEPTTEKYIELQTVDSTNFIKMWVDKNDYTKILWYTKAEKPQLNSDSSYMFNNLNNLKSQDITNICDTSKVTNMTQMFYRM